MQHWLYPTPDDIRRILAQARAARIGVLGDFCVDAYWFIDSGREEWSIETGKRVQHVRRQRYSPGAAGNVLTNLRALGVEHLEAFGVIGPDLYGQELLRELAQLGASTAGMQVQAEGWDTPVYGKPYSGGEELQRMDFGAFNALDGGTWRLLLSALREARGRLDFLIVNQQLPSGWCDERRAREMADELEAWRGRHLVDSRHYAGLFGRACRKFNEREATRSAGREMPDGGWLTDEAVIELAGAMISQPQFITRGERGIAARHAAGVDLIPGVAILGPTDIVGAGDTATAALAACLSGGASPAQSAVLANLAASITVQKLNQTGTASEEEMAAAARDLAYVHQPVLADEPRRAAYHGQTEIEVVEERPGPGPLRYAVFDHDGTISTLRQGWEQVMAPVMVRAVLGDQVRTADSALYAQVERRVRGLIDQTTGIQTILQMDELVKLVAEFGLVPERERLDAFGYKAVYNEALMQMVDGRLARLRRGELVPDDFIMKGAVPFLRGLAEAGVTLFLVSGTDEADVVHEAEALGYAPLFAGGILGARPGSRACSKEGVIQDILDHRVGRQSPAGSLLVAGDGPVEIRLGRRYGGWALGVASHEERRFGLNETKRRRVIRAGAHAVVPDFSQWRELLAYLLRG